MDVQRAWYYAECQSCHEDQQDGTAIAAAAHWTRTLTATTPLAFTGPEPGPHSVRTVDPLALFRLFVSDEVMDAIVAATNSYASNKYSESKVPMTHSIQHIVIYCTRGVTEEKKNPPGCCAVFCLQLLVITSPSPAPARYATEMKIGI